MGLKNILPCSSYTNPTDRGSVPLTCNLQPLEEVIHTGSLGGHKAGISKVRLKAGLEGEGGDERKARRREKSLPS